MKNLWFKWFYLTWLGRITALCILALIGGVLGEYFNLEWGYALNSIVFFILLGFAAVLTVIGIVNAIRKT